MTEACEREYRSSVRITVMGPLLTIRQLPVIPRPTTRDVSTQSNTTFPEPVPEVAGLYSGVWTRPFYTLRVRSRAQSHGSEDKIDRQFLHPQRRGIARLVLLSLFLTASNGRVYHSFAQSFDCAKAQSAVEQAVCGDAALGIMDNKLAAAFKDALAAIAVPAERQGLLASERYWLSHRDHQCSTPITKGCVDGLYRARIEVLRSVQTDATTRTDFARAALPTVSRGSLVRLNGGWRSESQGPAMGDHGPTLYVRPTYLSLPIVPDTTPGSPDVTLRCYLNYEYNVTKITHQDVSPVFHGADGEWSVYITAQNPKLAKGGPTCSVPLVRVPILFIRVDVPEVDPKEIIGVVIWSQCDSAQKFAQVLDGSLPQVQITDNCLQRLLSKVR
jgi:uncharacterized protein